MPYMNTGNTTAEDRSRLLARFPAMSQMAPMAAPAPAPAPAAPQYPAAPPQSRATMATPTYGTNSATPSYQQGSISSLTNPQSVGAGGLFPGLKMPGSTPQANPYADLSDEQQRALADYFHSLAGIDYKGSRESAALQQKMLADLFRGWNMEGPVDYTSAAPLADQFDNSRERLMSALAARGINGGVVGGALSNSYSQEARGIGDYIRQLLQQRQEQRHNDYQRFLDRAYGLNARGLQQNIDEQNSGGFWDALAGVGGSLIGGLVPGVGQALGHSLFPGGKP